MNQSNIYDNGQYAVHTSACNDPLSVVDATDNWWGTIDSAAIESMIHHQADSYSLPVVDYIPFATSPFDIDDSTMTDIEDRPSENLPDRVILQPNYPNPFNPSTTIVYALSERSPVALTVYNILGARVRTLVNRIQTAGTYSVTWDGRDNNGQAVAGGVYFYRLACSGEARSRKMLLVK